MRRVVAGVNSEGRSAVFSDTTVGAADGPAIFRVGGGLPQKKIQDIPDAVPTTDAIAVQLWESRNASLADVEVDDYSRADEFTLEPDLEGMYWRYFVWGPNKNAAFHTTTSLDLKFVISGSVTLLLDEGSVTLHAGDALVLQAASHGWSTGDEGCEFLHLMRKLG